MDKKRTSVGLWIRIFQSVKVILVNQVDSAVEGDGFWEVGAQMSTIKLAMASTQERRHQFPPFLDC